MSKSEIILEVEDFYKILDNKDNIIQSLYPLGDEALKVSYKSAEDAAQPLRHGNVALAAFVTATARLKLYEFLEPLGKRVLYMDTVRFNYIYIYIYILSFLCRSNPLLLFLQFSLLKNNLHFMPKQPPSDYH